VLNQLLKFTLVSSLLLWLRPRWKGLLALAVAVVMVHVLHGEYLEYVQLSGNDTQLVLSYVIKWVVLLAVAAVYVGFLVWGAKPGKSARAAARPPRGGSGRTSQDVPQQAGGGARPDDGFDFLRRKKHLENQAEKIISAKPRGNDR
jgi:hypothetical protein